MTKNQPKGAEALMIALSCPNPQGSIGIPVLLWGRPGVGKSSFIESLASETTKVLTLIASIHDPTDFSGLPVHHEGQVKYAIPEWVKEFETVPTGILFLDELSTAPPSVQAALLRVVLERKVGFHELPKQVRIVAAANPPDLMVGGWELSPPLRNRFIHLQWDISAEQYIRAIDEGWDKGIFPKINPSLHAKLLPEWKVKIAAFLKISPNMLHASPEENNYGFASPRTWDFAAHLLAACEILDIAPITGESGTTTCVELLSGCLGEGITVAFMEFLKNMRLPNPADVLDGKQELQISDLDDSELYIIFNTLGRTLENRFDQAILVSSALKYFDLTTEVFKDGRRDLIYVSLKKISRKGLLMKAMAMTQKHAPEDTPQIMSAINELFKDEGLREFIEVFENEA